MVGVPLGIDNYAELRSKGYDYVDKTGLITYLDRSGYKAYLFTRPRRFGKSLNLSMIDCYYNLKYEGNGWFEGTDVSRDLPDDPRRNSYPVVRIDMKGLRNRSMERFWSSLRMLIGDLYARFPYLSGSDRINPRYRAYIDAVLVGDPGEEDLVNGLRYLTEMLEAYHGRKAVVLVDEYDNAVNDCPDDGVREEISDVLKDVMESTFKGNDSLEFGVITGIMQIAKDGMFSGLNNVKTDSVFDAGNGSAYGFTEEEVSALMGSYGHPELMDEVREWYDGYRYGGCAVYNPWSILEYISCGFRPARYWIDTGDNRILGALLETGWGREDLGPLSEGGSVTCSVSRTLTYGNMGPGPDAVLQIMAMCGYLSPEHREGNVYDMRIPNREVAGALTSELFRRTSCSSDKLLAEFVRALSEGDSEAVGSSLSGIFMEFESFRILNRESDHRNFVYGMMLGTMRGYRPSVEGEAGEGYYDIRMEPLKAGLPNIVMEIKKVRGDSSDEALSRKADEALEQIRSKSYASRLPGRTLMYGVAFRGKGAAVRYRESDGVS